MPTLEVMRGDVMTEADLTEGQVDPDDIDRLLNKALAETYELIVQSREGYYSSEADFSLVAVDAGVMSLPVDYYEFLDLEDFTDSANPVSLPPFEWKARNSVWVKSYCVQGNNLLIRPTDSAVGTYKLTYVPAWVDLNEDDDWSPPNNWHDHAILGVSIRLKEQQELSTSDLQNRRKDVETRIRNAAAKRTGPRRVRDTRAAEAGMNDRRFQDWRFR